jgi:hypothetical protein
VSASIPLFSGATVLDRSIGLTFSTVVDMTKAAAMENRNRIASDSRSFSISPAISQT